MNKLLQFSTYGIKNIEDLITIDFANQTIENGIQKINNVKGIFGYNGAGKSALMSAVNYYNKIVCNPNYLMQIETKDNLNKLVNYVKKEFFFSIIFEYEDNIVIKHSLKLVLDTIMNDYVISEESISLSSGRTLNDKYKVMFEKRGNEIFVDENLKGANYDFIFNQDLKYNSIVQIALQNAINKKNNNDEVSVFEKIVLSVYMCTCNIDVYLQDSDLHRNYKFDKRIINNLVSQTEEIKLKSQNWIDVYMSDAIISKEYYNIYKQENEKLEKFIKYFKPELKKIELILLEDGSIYHVRRLFVYKDYNVELEFESSGIKQLVKLYSYLEKCANGKIVFIDEIDTNINAVYFEKMISFFKNYGKGQLIFTTHNIEAMKALRDQSRSIVVLGVDNKIDTWVGKGNKSPINDYINGDFPHSPMNVEDFDFINIFLGNE
ncbi:MAG: ATP-binding protein [Clostridia bacterium]|nr:ATP-binding protein [Clostridia bacterium]